MLRLLKNKNHILIVLLMLIAAFSRLIPHPPNFTPLTAIALFGLIKYNQIPNFYGIIGITLIVIGVILLNTLGKTT